ncbi:major outer membrane protein [Arcobacter sp. CECT 8985]|uniref:major outer membrane protein n=1 Tax=Arcobacter sp. CECT 8985 TaxID=1935424 RepID=UPI00100AD947|nr:major outer membrane protein [Arcobacter sp. CECT 8985]RXJ87426.1 hypothetical protein CRU93_03725 [Arcobacter sp. CECT 8985]
MKKFAKMSLVAAVAVAGLTTTSSAKALEDAIKNVDVSGTVVYRYDDRQFDNSQRNGIDKNGNYKQHKDQSKNNYKIALTAKAKVNEDVTAVTRFIVGSPTDAGFVSLNTTQGGDAQADVTLSNVYFSYTGLKNTTINLGKQGLTTPWTVAIDADGNEQTGTGILALTNVGPVTLAAAYFNQTNLGESGAVTLDGTKYYDGNKSTDVIEGDEDVATIGIMGNVGPVALDAWYLNMAEGFDTYTIGALAKFNVGDVKLSIGARHTELDVDQELAQNVDHTDSHKFDGEDNSLTKLELAANMGIFGAKVAYGWTDREGGLTALDNDAKTTMNGWILTVNGIADAKFLKTSVDAQVLPNLNIALNYNRLDKDETSSRAKDTTDTAYYLQASYKMSKNFGGYIRFGHAEFENSADNHDNDNDGTVGRLQVQYSF